MWPDPSDRTSPKASGRRSLMRHATLFVCSTAHLPVAERRHIDHLIAVAPRGADGRVEVGHPDLVIEPYAYGFFVHTCVVGCGGEAPDIRPEFWAILDRKSTRLKP